jgi:hypothetical protein
LTGTLAITTSLRRSSLTTHYARLLGLRLEVGGHDERLPRSVRLHAHAWRRRRRASVAAEQESQRYLCLTRQGFGIVYCGRNVVALWWLRDQGAARRTRAATPDGIRAHVEEHVEEDVTQAPPSPRNTSPW